MSRPVPPTTARKVVETYEPSFRARMFVRAEEADELEALVGAIPSLTPAAADLLDLLLFLCNAGDPVPERLRGLIERVGEPLWRAAILLPRQSHGGGDVHPLRYCGSCRLNPALRGHKPELDGLDREGSVATFPPSDARWDAVVVAALLSDAPGVLTQDGTLRKDVERRIYTTLGGDPNRWTLALQIARLVSLVRPSEGRLRGFPEAVPRPLGDSTALFPDPMAANACAILLRCATDGWMDLEALITRFGSRCRELLCSPIDGRYADKATVAFDTAGWETVEAATFRSVADTLHRAGVLDAARSGHDIVAVRRPGARPSFSPGFVLLPDCHILIHSGELSSPEYGRLARLAPYEDGERMHRHRLTREGVAADLAAGHRDTVDFLSTHSRTGVPANILDTVREWQRSATRVSVLTGVDVLEEDDGTLSLAAPGAEGRVIDYTKAPRARFLYRKGRISIPDGWDPLTVRSVVERIARPAGREGEERVYTPERRKHADVAGIIARLEHFYGGELPGEIEALILSGSGVGPLRIERAWVIHLPPEAAAALRRDWVAGPILRRAITLDEVVVSEDDLPRLRERMTELGIGWSQ